MESLAVTDGDGSQMLRGRKPYLMGMDTTGVAMDGDGLISHYRAGLYFVHHCYCTDQLITAVHRKRIRDAHLLLVVIITVKLLFTSYLLISASIYTYFSVLLALPNHTTKYLDVSALATQCSVTSQCTSATCRPYIKYWYSSKLVCSVLFAYTRLLYYCLSEHQYCSIT